MSVERTHFTNEQTGDTYEVVLDFLADTYTLYINEVLFETRSLNDDEWELDAEENESPIVGASDDKLERQVRRLRAMMRELLDALTDSNNIAQPQGNVRLKPVAAQAIRDAGANAIGKKRPRQE